MAFFSNELIKRCAIALVAILTTLVQECVATATIRIKKSAMNALFKYIERIMHRHRHMDDQNDESDQRLPEQNDNAGQLAERRRVKSLGYQTVEIFFVTAICFVCVLLIGGLFTNISVHGQLEEEEIEKPEELAEHSDFLLEKIKESEGNLIQSKQLKDVKNGLKILAAEEAEKVAKLGEEKAEKPHEIKLEEEPVQIVRSIKGVDGEQQLDLDRTALSKLLLDPMVANKKVMPLAIAGPFRKGKSFAMNFFLRYLNHLANGRSGSSGDWLLNATPLEAGFAYQSGSSAHTRGIWVWPRPFLLKNAVGEEIAVILMDSEGNFDPNRGTHDNALIFALSMVFSSNLLYNLQSEISNDKLYYLQYFAQFAEQGKHYQDLYETEAPFETLTFLVRDWIHVAEFAHGFAGGQALLERDMNLTNGNSEVRRLRHDIRVRLFQSVRAFLMPEPGQPVKMGTFSGHIGDVDPEFLAQMHSLAEGLFSPANLRSKKLNGSPMTGRELHKYFEAYFNLTQRGNLNVPVSPVKLMADMTHTKAFDTALPLYSKCMDEVFSTNAPLSWDYFNSLHSHCQNRAMSYFFAAKKMGAPSVTRLFGDKLKEQIKSKQGGFSQMNSHRWEVVEKRRKERCRGGIIGTAIICGAAGTYFGLPGTFLGGVICGGASAISCL